MTGPILSVLGASLPVAAWLLLLRRTRARDLGGVVSFCAAVGLGLGTASLVWWLLRQLPFASTDTLPWLDAGTWTTVTIALAIWVPRTPAFESVAGFHEARRLTPELMAALAVLIPISVLAAATFASRSIVVPHGEWDAWAIWNARARALFLSVPAPGAEAPPLPVLTHPDYPELLPASIARAWTYIGVDHVIVPIAMAAMYAAGAALVAGASISRHSTGARGLVAAAFILASPALVNWTWSQGADVPLSFYILLTFVFAASAIAKRDSPSLWALAGLSASLAAWTKNEGLLFMLVSGLTVAVWIVRQVRERSRWRSITAFAAGAAPALIVLLAFKLSVESSNEHVTSLTFARASEVLTWDRFSIVGRAMARELWYGGATAIGTLPVLALFVAVNGVPGRRIPGARLALVTLALMLAAYAMVYVWTPKDLEWHLRTSLDRLVLQLMPSMVWAGMLVSAREGNAGQPPLYVQLARRP